MSQSEMNIGCIRAEKIPMQCQIVCVNWVFDDILVFENAKRRLFHRTTYLHYRFVWFSKLQRKCAACRVFGEFEKCLNVGLLENDR